MLSVSRPFFLLLVKALLFASFFHPLCVVAKTPAWEESLMRHLAEGKQSEAESIAQEKLQKVIGQIESLPQGSKQIKPLSKELSQVAFWNAVLERSRFSIEEATGLFALAIAMDPTSLESKGAALAIGVDLAEDKQTAFYFYSALLALAQQNPENTPILWLTGILSRALTGNYYNYSATLSASELFHIQNCGVEHYERLLEALAPGPGPVLVHQTLANILGDLHRYESAIHHRKIALDMEHAPWVLHAFGKDYLDLGRYDEAQALIEEAVSKSTRKPPAYYFKDLGFIHWHQQRYPEALEAWEQASEIDPSFPDYWYLYLQACRMLGDYPRARNFIAQTLERYPDFQKAHIMEARMAALCEDPEATSKIKEAGTFDFKMDTIKEDGNPADPWFEAINFGDTQAFMALVETKDINAPITENYSQTPLMIAASKGWMPILQELIRRGAHLDAVDANKNTALHYAAQFTMPETAAALLEAGANPNLRDKWNQTPLMMSLTSGNRLGAKILLAHGADPKLSAGRNLNLAASMGEVELVKRMLALGASANATTGPRGDTPIMAACSADYPQAILAPLLEAGADIHAQNNQGDNVLHRAMQPRLHQPLIDFLVAHGADPTHPNALGMTPITQARLLGYDDLAANLEKTVGQSIPFAFLDTEEPASARSFRQAALPLVTPLLLAHGQEAGTFFTEDKPDKSLARDGLKQIYGITEQKQFDATLENYLNFSPKIQTTSLQLPEIRGQKVPRDILLSYVEETHSEKLPGPGENAWALANTLCLADLGVRAGMLPLSRYESLMQEMLDVAQMRFDSREAFHTNFLLGVRYCSGWEYERYAAICHRLANY